MCRDRDPAWALFSISVNPFLASRAPFSTSVASLKATAIATAPAISATATVAIARATAMATVTGTTATSPATAATNLLLLGHGCILVDVFGACFCPCLGFLGFPRSCFGPLVVIFRGVITE